MNMTKPIMTAAEVDQALADGDRWCVCGYLRSRHDGRCNSNAHGSGSFVEQRLGDVR